MAEFFAVGKENLNDTIRADHLRPRDAALIEPLACVAKSIRSAGVASTDNQHAKQAVIGLGTMGLMHMLVLPDARGYDLKAGRVEWARNLGLDASHSDAATTADIVIVCPGNADALALATRMVAPGGTIVLFAPMPPTGPTRLDLNGLYFKDARLVSSYSCGPTDTAAATELIRAGTIRAEQVVSDFIRLDELPKAYQAMKAGEILKAMVMFS
jgi:L-iditol 2-dehydrogenase